MKGLYKAFFVMCGVLKIIIISIDVLFNFVVNANLLRQIMLCSCFANKVCYSFLIILQEKTKSDCYYCGNGNSWD